MASQRAPSTLSDGELASELARLRVSGEESSAKAANVCWELGTRLLKAGKAQEAVGHLEAYSECVEAIAQSGKIVTAKIAGYRCQAATQLARALLKCGNKEFEAERAAERAVEAAHAAGQTPFQVGNLLELRAQILREKSPAKAAALLKEAAAGVLQNAGETEALSAAQWLVTASHMYITAGKLEAAEEAARRAAEVKHGNVQVRAMALQNRGVALLSLGWDAEMLEVFAARLPLLEHDDVLTRVRMNVEASRLIIKMGGDDAEVERYLTAAEREIVIAPLSVVGADIRKIAALQRIHLHIRREEFDEAVTTANRALLNLWTPGADLAAASCGLHVHDLMTDVCLQHHACMDSAEAARAFESCAHALASAVSAIPPAHACLLELACLRNALDVLVSTFIRGEGGLAYAAAPELFDIAISLLEARLEVHTRAEAVESGERCAALVDMYGEDNPPKERDRLSDLADLANLLTQKGDPKGDVLRVEMLQLAERQCSRRECGMVTAALVALRKAGRERDAIPLARRKITLLEQEIREGAMGCRKDGVQNSSNESAVLFAMLELLQLQEKAAASSTESIEAHLVLSDCHRARARARAASDRDLEMRATRFLATFQKMMGLQDEYLETLDEQQALAGNEQGSLEAVKNTIHKAHVMADDGRYPIAIRLLDDVVEDIRKSGDRSPAMLGSLCKAQMESARCLSRMNEHARAVDEVQASVASALEALEAGKQAGVVEHEHQVYKSLAQAYDQLGNSMNVLCRYEDALQAYQNALGVNAELLDEKAQCHNMGGLGTVYNEMGEVARAKEYFEKALEQAESLSLQGKLRDARLLCTCHGNLGTACLKLDELEMAKLQHERALQLAHAHDMREEIGRSSGNLGNVYLRMAEIVGADRGDDKRAALDNAAEHHAESLKHARNGRNKLSEGRALGNLGNVHTNIGMHLRSTNIQAAVLSFDRACKFHEEHWKLAVEVGDSAGEASASANLGDALRHLGRNEEAIQCYENQLRLSEELCDQQNKAKALSSLARCKGVLGGFDSIGSDRRNVAERAVGGAAAVRSIESERRHSVITRHHAERFLALAAQRESSRQGTLKSMQRLVETDGKLDVNAQDECGRTALHLAAEAGKLDIVEWLVEGKTRLGHSTPFAGGPVRELVMVNAETHNYETPYQLALLKGHMKVVEYLRETAGAMPFVKVFSRCTASNPENEDQILCNPTDSCILSADFWLH